MRTDDRTLTDRRTHVWINGRRGDKWYKDREPLVTVTQGYGYDALGVLMGVMAFDRWNSSTFLSDFFADRLRVGVMGGADSSSLCLGRPRSRDREAGTKSDRCLFGLALFVPGCRGVGGGRGSRKSGLRSATPSVEFRVGSRRLDSDAWSSVLALALEGDKDGPTDLGRNEVRRSH